MQRLGVALVGSLVLWSMGLMSALLKRLLGVQLVQKVAKSKGINSTRKGFPCQEAFICLQAITFLMKFFSQHCSGMAIVAVSFIS